MTFSTCSRGPCAASGRDYLLLVHNADHVEERCRFKGATPTSRVESWTVLGDDDIPIEPIERFLTYLSDIERSPNTVRPTRTT